MATRTIDHVAVARKRTNWSARVFSVGALTPVVLISLAVVRVPPTSANAICDTTWVGGDGDWSDDAQWSNHLPTSQKRACILGSTTYTVTVHGPQVTMGLTLGGTAGTQTLALVGSSTSGQGALTLEAQGNGSTGIGANGTIRLDSTDASTYGFLDIEAGTLTNQGTIQTAPRGGGDTGPELIYGDIDNQGTMTINGNTAASSDPDWTTSGTITVGTDRTLTMSGGTPGLTQSAGTTRIAARATLSIQTGSYALLGGTLKGAGALSGSVINSGGTFSPGSSPGVFTVSGDYTQGPGGRLAIEISGAAGTLYDQLRVTGSASLDGVLAVVATYNPSISDRFLIVKSAARTGQFSQLTVTAPLGKTFRIQYDEATVVLVPTLEPKILIDDASVVEGNSGSAPATFTVSLSEASDVDVTVHYHTVDGSALAPADYTATSGTLTFKAGDTSEPVAVWVEGDGAIEENETFAVLLSNPVNGLLDDSGGAGIVANDDGCTILGTSEADTLVGTSGADVICGLAGDDTITGGLGNDTIDGGPGTDTVSFQEAAATSGLSVNLGTGAVSGGLGTDTIKLANGRSTVENIAGSDFADTLQGDDGDNTILSNGGNDTFLAADPRGDTYDGGPGADSLSYATANLSVNANLATGQVTDGLGTDSISVGTVENLKGSAFGDTLTGDGGANQLTGLGGGDMFFGGLGDDRLSGGAGNDTLLGGPGVDTFTGGDGTDTVSFAESAATAGVTANLATGAVTGGLGADHIEFGVESLIGTPFGDTLIGNRSANSIFGRNGADTLRGGLGPDRLDGGFGADTVSFVDTEATGGVTASLSTGVVSGGLGADTIVKNTVENLRGTRTFGDTLSGNLSANVLSGLGGNDSLNVKDGFGNDTVDGGLGGDTCTKDAGDAAISCP
jgi:Calx-beta domain/RTX calcium-binding nonapeptide repeat (4 copies)